MTMPLIKIKTGRRPSWMTPWGEEGLGDAWSDRLWREWPRFLGEEWVPSFNFYEKEGNYYLNAEIPGVDKENISITIDNNVLTISGKKETKKEEEGANYYLKESTYGSFSRSLRLPGEVEEGKIQANFKDGVLSLTLPQKKTPEAKQIKIETK
ncbi:MAG: Hsp20/alpha crystallin family protein [Deltaproteobacteria bacterium]|nr:Hsp20/alpha crystallin family protein [Deltaproteobacteria bacterium]